MKRTSLSLKTVGWLLLAAPCYLALTSHAGTFKRITIDGSYADWAGVPVAYEDPADSPASSDYRQIWIANDDDYLYVRFTLENPQDPFTANDNLFVDADNDPSTGFSILVGSELLVQGGAGYQERDGGFNEGGIEGLDWQGAPSGSGTQFEFRISRKAKYASDATAVFQSPLIALVLEGEDANFTRKETAPDAEGLVYEFAERPGAATGTTVVLPFNAAWKYSTTASGAWTAPDFDDAGAGWSAGSALFGFTPSPASYPQPITTPLNAATKNIYLRTKFQWTTDPTGVDLIATNYLSDGAAFYLNGEEVRRVRLPGGPLTAATAATGGPGSAGQAELLSLPSAALVVGENVLAVEVHQASATPNDLVFGLNLIASTQFPVVFTDAAEPADRAVVAGQGTTFAAAFAGSQPLTIQWLKNGSPVEGATNATLTLETVLADAAGAYSVRISNPYAAGSITSRAAVLTVLNTPVSITQPPIGQQIAEGQPVTLSVTAAGSAPLSYQWYKDQQPIPGATSPTFSIDRAQLEDSGQYVVEVSNPTPSTVRSTAVTLAVVRDSTPPTWISAAGGPNRAILVFSEPLDPASAASAANYTLSGGLTVISATPSADNAASVTLVTSKQTLGTRYEVTANNLKDRFGNTIAAGSRRAFVSTIVVDGSFDDWDGVAQLIDDPEDAENATDYAAAWVANDADYIYLRVRLHRPSNFGIFYNNLFFDADNDVSTGFLFRSVGSEMLVQGGGGYQQKGGGFNEGAIENLNWSISPEGVASEFEVRFSRHAKFASDGQPVFAGDTIGFYLESENTSFQTVDVAPDAEPVVYTFSASTPTDLAPLIISRDGSSLRITWEGAGRLQSTDRLGGSWLDVAGASSPYTTAAPTSGARFYRLAQ